MKNLVYSCMVFLGMVAVVGLVGCTSQSVQSGTVTSRSEYPSTLNKARKAKSYMILHSGINAYSIASVELDKKKQQMTVQLDKLDSLHLANIPNPESQTIKAEKADAPSKSETHVYLSDSTSYTLDEPHTIVLDKITRIELKTP